METKVCPSCNKSIDFDSSFCHECGLPQVCPCPYCGQDIEIDSSQCKHCNRFLSFCSECFRLHKADAVNCESCDINSQKPGKIKEFFPSFLRKTVDYDSSKTFLNDYKTLKTNIPKMTYRVGARISDIVSSFGHIYFVDEERWLLMDINYLGKDGDIEINHSIMPFRTNNDSEVAKIAISGEFVYFFVRNLRNNSSFEAYIYRVYDLSQYKKYDSYEHNEISILQTQIILANKWILIGLDDNDQGVLVLIDLDTGENTSIGFPEGLSYKEAIPILAKGNMVYISTERKVICFDTVDQKFMAIRFNQNPNHYEFVDFFIVSGQLHLLNKEVNDYSLYSIDLETLGSGFQAPLSVSIDSLEGIFASEKENEIYFYSKSKMSKIHLRTKRRYLEDIADFSNGNDSKTVLLLNATRGIVIFRLELLQGVTRIYIREVNVGKEEVAIMREKGLSEPDFILLKGGVVLYDRTTGYIVYKKIFA